MMTKKLVETRDPSPPLAFDPVEAALRQIFDEIAQEEIPPEFAALVARLEPGPPKAEKS